MSEFLTTSGLTYAIEKIIKTARKKIVIISPYIKMDRNYFERLQDAVKKNVSVTVVYGKTELTMDQDQLLSEFDKLDLFFCDNLHAKCYLNEDLALITSMNLHQYSQSNNREMGLLVERKNEYKVYSEINDEIESIIDASEVLDIKKGNSHVDKGYCIRCGIKITLDPRKPLCSECYYEWNQYKNPFYEEEFCHSCGKKETTTIEKPLCFSCYKEYSTNMM